MRPSCVERCAKLLASWIGRQSISARKPDRARRVADPQPSDDPGLADAAMHLDAAELGELCGDEIGGAVFLEAEFGMRVDVAPQAVSSS